MTDVSENKNAAVSRRNALKAGAALGVGAAAFAGPQIGVLGQAPAYAMTCSIPPVTAAGPDRNTNGSCSPILFLQSDTVSVTFNGQTYTYGIAGCSDTDAGWTIPTLPSTVDCEVRVIPIDGNGDDVTSIVVPGTDFCRNNGPNNCGSAGFDSNSRYRIEVTCAQAGCL